VKGGWTKLFASLVTSSVWCEDDATVRVWIAMLATADSEGLVEGSVPGFANLARVSVDQMRAAIARLSGPDPDSRTPDHEGRRIEAAPGGWRILNYHSYRDRPQAKEGSRAPYMRAYRQKHLAGGVTCNTETVTRDTEGNVTRDTEGRGQSTENGTTPPSAREAPAMPAPPAAETSNSAETARRRQEVTALLDRLGDLGFARAVELRRASEMPARNGHRARWAAAVAELGGRWLTVTLEHLRRRVAEVEAAVVGGDSPVTTRGQDHEPPDAAAEDLWAAIGPAVRAAIGEESWATWLRGLRPAGIAGAELVLEAVNDVTVSWIARCYAAPLASAAARQGVVVRLTHQGRGGKRGMVVHPAPGPLEVTA
jgi:hypothetical protein